LKKPVALGFGYAYTAHPTNAGLVGFAVVGLGDVGFSQYRRGSLKVSAFGQVGLNDRAVGRLSAGFDLVGWLLDSLSAVLQFCFLWCFGAAGKK
jgi:hypothetical protein